MGMLKRLKSVQHTAAPAPAQTPMQALESAFIAQCTSADKLIIKRSVEASHCRILLAVAGIEKQIDLTSKIALAFGLMLFDGVIGYSNLYEQLIVPLAKVSGPISNFDLV